LGVVERDLKDCSLPGLSPDRRLAIAYAAALQAATAALAAEGYRAAREAHHYRVIESLAYTVGLSQGEIRTLDAFRKKRNLCDYEVAGSVSEQEAVEALAFAKALKLQAEGWLRDKHPGLVAI
jgi:hypothetical protein